jgi:hypothetical protein
VYNTRLLCVRWLDVSLVPRCFFEGLLSAGSSIDHGLFADGG